MKPTQSPFSSKKTVSSAVAVERATSASSSSAAGKRVLKEFKVQALWTEPIRR
ncbi:hypothetical protein DIPPA_01539 [Diplonema papillatum]|nr:hypothetical protein DIPPA_01539 [Diplonema papillatum]